MYKALSMVPGKESISVVFIAKIKAPKGPMVKKGADLVLRQCFPDRFEY